jgi:hypothetical protein
MGATCRNCGKEWDRDPALEVDCPTCSAEAGQQCERPSGHKCRVHTKRDERALEEVCDYSKCPATSAPGRPAAGSSSDPKRNETTNGTTRQTTL